LQGSAFNADQGGEDGFTPLMTAAEAGHTAVVSLLLNSPHVQPNR
jgi:ankyrin repeat protein